MSSRRPKDAQLQDVVCDIFSAQIFVFNIPIDFSKLSFFSNGIRTFKDRFEL